MDEKMWCLHTMELYSALKNNKVMTFARKGIQVEVIEQTMLAAEGRCDVHPLRGI